MAFSRRKGLILALLAAALLAIPAAASAGHFHRHYGHRHHWHGGRRWHVGHHWHHRHWNVGHWGHRHWGYRHYWRRPWYSGGYVNIGWNYYRPYRYYSYWSYPSFYFQYTPRSYYYGTSYPYYYGCSTTDPATYEYTYAAATHARPGLGVLLGDASTRSATSLTEALVARTPRVLRAEVAEEPSAPVPVTRLASRTTPAKPAAAVRATLRPSIERVSLDHSATRVLASGDRAFQSKRYANAAGFYQIAAERAPQSVQGHLRAGHALLAARRYHDAYRTFCQAIALNPAYVQQQFGLAELYTDPAEQQAHLERLAKTTLDNPNNAALHALLGLYLVHDGQADRADKFFAEARRLSEGKEAISASFEGSPAAHVASTVAAAVR